MRKKSSSQPSMLSGAVILPLTSYRPPTGGQHSNAPEFVNRRAQVTPDLWVSLTTRWSDHRPTYVVRLIDAHNMDHRDPQEFPTPRRARNAANRLYRAMTEEN